MDRVKFFTHRGKRILSVDCSNCGPEELMEIFEDVEQTVAAEPPSSVLILTDFTGAKVNKQAADRLKVAAARDKPQVRRAAFIGGAEAIHEVFYHNLESFSGRKFPSFHSRDEALAWLLGEKEEAAAS